MSNSASPLVRFHSGSCQMNLGVKCADVWCCEFAAGMVAPMNRHGEAFAAIANKRRHFARSPAPVPRDKRKIRSEGVLLHQCVDLPKVATSVVCSQDRVVDN